MYVGFISSSFGPVTLSQLDPTHTLFNLLMRIYLWIEKRNIYLSAHILRLNEIQTKRNYSQNRHQPIINITQIRNRKIKWRGHLWHVYRINIYMHTYDWALAHKNFCHGWRLAAVKMGLINDTQINPFEFYTQTHTQALTNILMNVWARFWDRLLMR